MKKKIHIISHTHWDREWYLSSTYVNQWLPAFFENLFRMLEKEPDYRFVLDGQTAIIDDCCEQLRNKDPESVRLFLERLKKYVQEGRIVVGPYYLQPDWQLLSEEALVRNLLYGRESAEQLGKRSDTGWLLDNFGQISQTVQIHEQFGIKGLMVWRGVGLPPEELVSEFYWESPDGTRLPSIYLLSSYRNGMRLTEYPNCVADRIRSEADKIKSFGQTNNLLLMNGYDQEKEPDDILPYIRGGRADTDEYEVYQSTPDEYLAAVTKELYEADIPILKGALYSGKYISVFPGILSSRMYLKLKNDTVQRLLEESAEPLEVMVSFAGGRQVERRLDSIWKLLLKNHPHDSICGVSADDVHANMERRFEAVEKEIVHCIRDSIEELAARIDTEKFHGAKQIFHVFNTILRPSVKQIFLPVVCDGGIMVKDGDGRVCEYQRTESGIITEVSIPAFGYQTVGVYEGKEEFSPVYETGDLPVMENEYLRVEFRNNGTFWLTDKRSGIVYKDMGYLEDCADNGDEYNFSYVAGDQPKTTLEEKADISLIERGTLRTVVKIDHRWKLPTALTEDRVRRQEDTVILPVTIFAILEKGSEILKFRVRIRNRCRDHRVRVMFPTGVDTDRSYAKTQFDITEHGFAGEWFDDSSMSDDVKRIVVGARECGPITQFPQRGVVAVTDGHGGIAVFSKGLPEYEVLPKDTTIALTLFRGVGWLAKTDLNTRIGDAGPEIFTPEAQCLRDMEFEYGIGVFRGNIEEAGILKKETAFTHSYVTAESTQHPGLLSPSYSFLEQLSDADICVTAVKRAQNGNGVIVRCFHSGKQREELCMRIRVPAKGVWYTRLSEEDGERINNQKEEVRIAIPSRRIMTLRIVPIQTQLEKVQKYQVRICRQERMRYGDFEQYPLPEVVSVDDVSSEEMRANRAAREYEAAQEEYRTLLSRSEDNRQLASLRLDMEIEHRTALEARLSAIYTKRKYVEIFGSLEGKGEEEILDETEREIKWIGDELNTVRVQRRAGEYWFDYFRRGEQDR